MEERAALEIPVMAGGGLRQPSKRPVGLPSFSSFVCVPVVGGVCMLAVQMVQGRRSW